MNKCIFMTILLIYDLALVYLQTKFPNKTAYVITMIMPIIMCVIGALG